MKAAPMKKNMESKTEFKSWRTFSIFISSTFLDMQAERDYLKHIIFPRVEEELRKNRIRLETVDLRWGVDTSSIKDESEREAKVLQVCLEEIRRCRPFFIGLLGDRYGWIPPEERMKDAIRKETNLKHKKDKSVTALEIEFGVLASEEQLNRSVFYFRDPLPYETFPVKLAAKYCDEYDPKLTVKEKSERKTALVNLKADIRDHFKKKNLKNKVKTYPVTWDAVQNKIVDLNAWGEMVYEDIIRECMAQAEITEDKVAKNVYEQEVLLLDAFIEDHTHVTIIKTDTGEKEVSTFCGREELIKELREHLLIEDKEKWGLALTGESGSGKSAVFSRVHRLMQEEDCFLLAHSAGISPRSRNVADLLHKWNWQMSKFMGIEYEMDKPKQIDRIILDNPNLRQGELDSLKPEFEIEEITNKFKELLFTIAENEQIVILIDALDRFEPTARAQNMTWLPQVMAGKVRVLCTAITGTEGKAVKYHAGKLLSRDIDHFTIAEANEMLEMLCIKQHKSLPSKVKKAILETKRDDGLIACSSPLWLSLAVNILMAMDNQDFEEIRKREGRPDQAINEFMIKLVREYPTAPGPLFLNLVYKAASYFGEDFTRKVFDYLACSRNGLRESDLEKLIPEPAEKWDALTFARIRLWFSAHIRNEGENLQWNLAHSILRKSILAEIDQEDKKNIHNQIADYLLTLPEIDDLRISETMFHLMKAGNAEKALDYYISYLPEENRGSTAVLAEAISKDEKNLDWCFDILRAAGEIEQKIMRLAPRYIYDLNDALKVDGKLIEREKLLVTLHDHIKAHTNLSDNEDFGYDFAALNEKLGSIYQSLGKLDQALEFYNKDAELSKELYESNPRNESLKNGLAISYEKLGSIYQSLGKLDQALEFYNLEVDLFKELYESNPRNESLKNGLAISYSKLGEIYQSLGKLDQALEFYNKDAELSKELYESNPNNVGLLEGLGISYYKMAMIKKEMGNDQGGRANFVDWKKIICFLAENFSQVPKYQEWKRVEY
ncbi:MAG: DUF4062 domain-containing protein [Candidatus Cloacimonetes bacterium]|nr:DUF4062 domain-containing protein [Candidatus Cloacimonadota bacterium]